eukprot:tig00000711_g3375.t1
MASPLGYCIPGRIPGVFAATPGDGTKFLASVETAQDLLSREDCTITLFLTGAVPLPGPLFCAALYVALGPPHADWTYVGHVSNETPSAVLKMKFSDAQRDRAISLGAQCSLQLGVSIEQLGVQPPLPPRHDYQEFAKFVAFDLFRFLESFSSGASDRINVPTNTLDQWYQKFTDKLNKDPQFWRNAGAKGG